MTLQEIVQILRARHKTVVTSFLTMLVLAIVLSYVIPDHYKAIATVVPNLKTSNPLDDSALSNALAATYEGTQIDIIESPRVGLKVIDKLRLKSNPDALEAWHASWFYRPDNFEDWALDWLKHKLTVEPPRDSNVLELKFSSKNPQFAVAAANAFAEAYVEATLELNVDPARNSAAWFEELTKPLRSKLAAAQSALSKFQQEHGIIATDDKQDVENIQLSELQGQLVLAEGMRADSRARQVQSRGAQDTLPEVLQNPVIADLKSQIAKDQAQLQDLGSRLGTNHPRYISMAAQLASLQQREAAEVNRVVGSLTSNNRYSAGREAELGSAIATQREKVLELRTVHDEAALLQREVDTAQRAYDMVMQRLATVTLESQLKQTNVSILSRALPPYKRSWPVLWIDMLVGAIVGACMGIGLALLQEFLDTRIHSLGQLAGLTQVPVYSLAMTKAANDAQSRRWVAGGKRLPFERRSAAGSAR